MTKVLVVDDDQATRDAARTLLEDAGYEVLEAPDGIAALHALRATKDPMVVILDLVMPHLTGAELLHLVGSDERLLRHAFVVWSASRHPIPYELMRSLRAPLVAKPFDLEELLAVVAEAVDRLEEEETG